MRLRKIASVPAIAAFLVGAAPPPASVPQDPDIVVTALPKDPAELRRRVAHFVGRIAQASMADQLSRRSSPICPKVIGVDGRHSKMVIEKIREAAVAAKIPELKEGCKANILVIFTEDGDALMASLRAKRPGFFTAIEPDKKRELFASGRAVRWWYGNEGHDQNGASVDADVRALNGAMSAGEAAHSAVYSASLISTQIVINLSGNVVVVDVTKAQGYPLDAIGAYVGMISMAQITAEDGSLAQAPSVLGMFARPVPRAGAYRELTAWDRAYLRGLYTIPMNRVLHRQRRALSTAMRDAIIED